MRHHLSFVARDNTLSPYQAVCDSLGTTYAEHPSNTLHWLPIILFSVLGQSNSQG